MLRRKKRQYASTMKFIAVSLLGGLVLTGITGGRAEGAGSAAQFLQDTVSSNPLVVFTKAECQFCQLTKQVFRSLHYQFVDVDLDRREDADDLQAALFDLTGSKTVPQVFVLGRYVGGGAQVLAWYRNGHLFSRSDVQQTTAEPEDERHAALAKLLRTSENAIKWIGNKTTGSLNGLFSAKNQSSAISEEPNTESPLVAKQKQLLSWFQTVVKDKFHFNSSPATEAESQASPEDSEERLVIAHRTKDQGFAWGPPLKNSSQELERPNATRGLFKGVHNVWSYLYQGTKSLTDRGKHFIQAGLTKVFAKKDPFLMRQYASESIEKQLENMEKSNGTHGVADIAFACDDTMKPICAVDVDKHYTIFQNECKMVLFNYKHGTNFSIYDNNVCMGLFARHPDLFYQNTENQNAQKNS